MTTLSQISMKFVDESTQPEEAPLHKEDQPVNVGLRLKKLKTVENSAITEEPVGPEPELVDVISNEEIQVSDPVIKIKSGRGRKSIRQISEEADLIQIPEDEILFQKHYYTMGEVADMFRVNQSLLRFWEAEFSILQPKKNKKGDRYFRPIDIKNLHLIYHLLRQRKYTIEGAKDFLKKNSKAEEKFETIKKLEEMKRFLLEMKASLG
ncbi:MAG TPA: MerR family transcriptional regulator [Puia sp.]|jgi:DNA-binding transcriptional MerR regulator